MSNEPLFEQTLKDTGIDYTGIVSRPKWAIPAYDHDRAWDAVNLRFFSPHSEPVKTPPPVKKATPRPPAKKRGTQR